MDFEDNIEETLENGTYGGVFSGEDLMSGTTDDLLDNGTSSSEQLFKIFEFYGMVKISFLDVRHLAVFLHCIAEHTIVLNFVSCQNKSYNISFVIPYKDKFWEPIYCVVYCKDPGLAPYFEKICQKFELARLNSLYISYEVGKHIDEKNTDIIKKYFKDQKSKSERKIHQNEIDCYTDQTKNYVLINYRNGQELNKTFDRTQRFIHACKIVNYLVNEAILADKSKADYLVEKKLDMTLKLNVSFIFYRITISRFLEEMGCKAKIFNVSHIGHKLLNKIEDGEKFDGFKITSLKWDNVYKPVSLKLCIQVDKYQHVQNKFYLGEQEILNYEEKEKEGKKDKCDIGIVIFKKFNMRFISVYDDWELINHVLLEICKCVFSTF